MIWPRRYMAKQRVARSWHILFIFSSWGSENEIRPEAMEAQRWWGSRRNVGNGGMEAIKAPKQWRPKINFYRTSNLKLFFLFAKNYPSIGPDHSLFHKWHTKYHLLKFCVYDLHSTTHNSSYVWYFHTHTYGSAVTMPIMQ